VRALLGYRLASLARSQRWAAPSVLFVVVIAVAAWNDAGPLLSLYGVCSATLLAAATWLGMATVNLEDPAQRAITLVTAGHRATLASQAGTAMLGCVGLAAVGVVLPVVVGHHTITPGVLLLGGGGQLGCACVGVGIAMLCCRWVLPRPGYALLAAVLLVVLAIIVPGASPVNPLLHALSGDHPSALVVLALDAAAVAVLLGGVELAHQVARRRD